MEAGWTPGKPRTGRELWQQAAPTCVSLLAARAGAPLAESRAAGPGACARPSAIDAGARHCYTAGEKGSRDRGKLIQAGIAIAGRETGRMIRYRRAGVDDGEPRAGLGSRVVVELVDARGQAERLSLALVPDDHADLQAGYLGAGTPLAAALMGRQAGETVPYRHGDLEQIRILEVEPFAVTEAPDAASARRAVIQKAVDKSNLQDTLRLALAVNVKWGDYDPSGIAPEDGPAEE